MHAFTPPASPAPAADHVQAAAAAKAGVCERMAAYTAAKAARSDAARVSWDAEQAELRRAASTAAPAQPASELSGPAAVLAARLARIVPASSVASAPAAPTAQPRAAPDPCHLAAYQERMRRHGLVSPVQAQAPAAPKPSAQPVKQHRHAVLPFLRTAPNVALPMAQTRPALSAGTGKAAQRVSKQVVRVASTDIPDASPSPQTAARTDEQVSSTAQVQGVPRPSLMDAVLAWWQRVVAADKDAGRDEDPASVAGASATLGAAAQVIAVILSLGRSQ